MRYFKSAGFGLLACLFFTSLKAQTIEYATAVAGDNYEYGIAIDRDAQGNTFFLGYSSEGPFEYEGVSYPNNGRGDAFIGKLDVNKNLLWVRPLGGDDPNYPDRARDLHVDIFGDVYIAVNSAGEDFTYNGQILDGIDSPGQYSGEGVLLKLDNDGNYLWHDSGTTQSYFYGITSDPIGNVYLTGNFGSNITLGNSIVLDNPSTGTTTDMFIAKYESNGNILWAKRAGGMPHNTFAYGYDVNINPLNNDVIVVGRGDGEVFYEGTPLPVSNGSDQAIVLVSYTQDGTLNWVKQILSQQYNVSTYGVELDINSQGVIAVAGYQLNISGLVGFYTSDGSIISEGTYPTSDEVEIKGIVLNDNNEAYISGH
ncbi:MAG: hypothetical protein HRU26_09095, partial [Psychroserpens sp.]|nr:hypothetical protein [Psychroserpens sp.]